jgi:hypothetical protein
MFSRPLIIITRVEYNYSATQRLVQQYVYSGPVARVGLESMHRQRRVVRHDAQ